MGMCMNSILYTDCSLTYSFLMTGHHIKHPKFNENHQHLFCVFRCPVWTKSWNLMAIRLNELHFSERKVVNRSNSTGTQQMGSLTLHSAQIHWCYLNYKTEQQQSETVKARFQFNYSDLCFKCPTASLTA